MTAKKDLTHHGIRNGSVVDPKIAIATTIAPIHSLDTARIHGCSRHRKHGTSVTIVPHDAATAAIPHQGIAAAANTGTHVSHARGTGSPDGSDETPNRAKLVFQARLALEYGAAPSVQASVLRQQPIALQLLVDDALLLPFSALSRPAVCGEGLAVVVRGDDDFVHRLFAAAA